MTRINLFALSYLASLILVAAQTNNPDSTCIQATRDSIQNCLDQIERDEANLPHPCTSTDWECICGKQAGILACYTPCPELTEFDAINFNDQNCRGQHGFTNAPGGNPAFTYSWSPITTTGAGSGGTAPTASNGSSSSAATSILSSSSSSSSSSTAPPSSSAPASGGSNAATSLEISRSAQIITACLVGAAMIGVVAL